MRSYRSYQEKRSGVVGKVIIGIDPGKARHHAVIINATGIPIGKTFSFSVSYNEFRKKLWEGKALSFCEGLSSFYKNNNPFNTFTGLDAR